MLKLPVVISDILLKKSPLPSDESMVKKYFREYSFISKILMKNPATFKMLELIYTKEGIKGTIDQYVFSSISGQALRYRLSSVIINMKKIIKVEVKRNNRMKILNLGSS